MKRKLPFPYWLWQEIVFTDSPHRRGYTIFHVAAVTSAVAFTRVGYWAGHELWGISAGILFAIPLGLLGLTMGYFLQRWAEDILRLLVRKRIIAEPDFRE
jgi:hypothetical protein